LDEDMDQCKHCTSRGNLSVCESTDCGYHQLWLVTELRKQIFQLKGALMMGQNNCEPLAQHTQVTSNICKRKPLSALDVGDWFLFFDINGTSTLSIKGDDSVHEGDKVICMNVRSGTLMRVKQTATVELVNSVELIIT